MGTRLDLWLVSNGKAKSRERAKELIQSSGVLVNGKNVTKPSFIVDESDNVTVVAKELKYVGRGGLKLEKALLVFALDVNGQVCIDLGASTGGFTDCLLQNGAAKVFAVDVGHGQLDDTLLQDNRVINLEGQNVKDLTLATIGQRVDFICTDLSFISVKNALPVIKNLLKENSSAVILIKPQFEAGKKSIGKGGIVKDRKAHIQVLLDISETVCLCGLALYDVDYSAIRGGDGNIEYIAHLKNNRQQKLCFDKNYFSKLVNRAFSEL